MANNILTAEIRVTAPGTAEAFNKVSQSVKKTEASLQSISTSSSSAGSSFTILSNTATKTGEATTKAAGGFKNMLAGLNLTRTAGLLLVGVLASIGKEIFNAVTGANNLASATKLLAKSQAEAEISTRAEVVSLQVLFTVAKDISNSYGERQAAIDKINKSYPELHKNLTLENIGTRAVQEAVDDLTKSLINQARLKLLIADIANLQNILSATETIKGGLFGLKDELISKTTNRINTLTESVINLQKELLGTSKTAGSLFGGVSEPGGISKVLGAGAKEINIPKLIIKPDEWEFVLPPLKPAKPVEFLINQKDIKLVLLGGDIDTRTFAEKAQDSITKGLEKLVKPPELEISTKGILTPEELAKIEEEFTAVASVVSGIVTPAFDAFFDAIQNGGDAFKAFGQAAVKALTQVIAKLAATAAISGILSLLGFGSFASLFGKLFQFRALGGPVSAGGSYIVGEKGPELFTPNTGGQIIPNNQLGGRGIGASGGMAVQVSGEFLLRGQNLLASITLANQSRNRLQ